MNSDTSTNEMGPLQPARTQLLGDRVLEQLRTAILRGHLDQGMRLREPELAKRLGVSRGPIRVALAALEQEGLAQSRPHHSMTVTKLNSRDVEEIYDVRRALEGLAAEKAAVNASNADIASMQAVLTNLEAAHKAKDLVEVSHLDVAFHDHLYRAAGNARLYRAWQNLRSQVTLFLVSRNTLAPTSRDIVIGEHAAIVNALTARDASTAKHLIEAHLLGAYERLRAHVPVEPSED